MIPPYCPTRAAGSANIQALQTLGNMQKHRGNTQKYISGGVAIFVAVLTVTFCQWGGSAAAQTAPTATPIPAVIATQQAADAAAAQVNGLQAERAQIEARLAEINRNIESQIAAATQAAADARNAAAAQNAVESGAAIGRLEGALAQLRESYAGKDSIIADLQTRIEQQAAQSAEDRRTIDRTGLELRQAQQDKQNVLSAYNAVKAQQVSNAQNDMVSNAVWLIVALAFLLSMITLAAYVLQRRRDSVVFAPPAPPDEEATDAEYTTVEEEQT